ncbi:MAG TPA: hypothetical protein VGX25_04255 [Actinophytocola sp.]|uniref:WXG100 family type VII secretion target n=1 Tax=Actinophytocola sp. TaxID=1872138 RepID=UPI002DDD5135|nr:hypothetical protein [Actinophytocola sp.]HEV2778592.1 hypothetical protein [Actinophytocola sp.]
MSEGFDVDPAHVAGYGELTGTSAVDAHRIAAFVRDHARSDGDFSGLMNLLRGPVDTYADKTHDRLSDRGDLLSGTSTELTRSAWVYSNTEESNYVIFGGSANGPPRPVGYAEFPNAVAYPAGTDIAGMLQAPEVEEASLEDAVDETGGTLSAIDDVVRAVTGWSPVEYIVEPLSGRWPALRQRAEVLRIAGEASEGIAANQANSLSTLDAQWGGGAAQAFRDHIQKVDRALEYEGPLNRVVAEVYDLVATQIENAAAFMVDVLGVAADKVRNALATGWIPGYGWYKAYDAVRTAWHIFNEAKDMIEDIGDAIDQVRAVVDAARDPMGAAEDWVREQLEPALETAEEAERTAQLAEDLEVLSDPGALTDAPDDPYQLGDPRRPGA